MSIRIGATHGRSILFVPLSTVYPFIRLVPFEQNLNCGQLSLSGSLGVVGFNMEPRKVCYLMDLLNEVKHIKVHIINPIIVVDAAKLSFIGVMSIYLYYCDVEFPTSRAICPKDASMVWI